MTDVKIYTITSDDLSPPIEGEGFCTDMVRHSDYAALEARFNKQAAEIASLKKFIEGDCWVIDPDRDEYLDAAQCVPETPVTDAWQREQMAKGVEIFSEQQRSYIGKPSKNDAASSYCSREALKFATQIRQGELS